MLTKLPDVSVDGVTGNITSANSRKLSLWNGVNAITVCAWSKACLAASLPAQSISGSMFNNITAFWLPFKAETGFTALLAALKPITSAPTLLAACGNTPNTELLATAKA